MLFKFFRREEGLLRLWANISVYEWSAGMPSRRGKKSGFSEKQDTAKGWTLRFKATTMGSVEVEPSSLDVDCWWMWFRKELVLYNSKPGWVEEASLGKVSCLSERIIFCGDLSRKLWNTATRTSRCLFMELGASGFKCHWWTSVHVVCRFSGQLQVNDNLIFLIFSFYFTHTGSEVILAPLRVVGPRNLWI